MSIRPPKITWLVIFTNVLWVAGLLLISEALDLSGLKVALLGAGLAAIDLSHYVERHF